MTEAVEALAGAGQQRPDLAGAVVFRGGVGFELVPTSPEQAHDQEGSEVRWRALLAIVLGILLPVPLMWASNRSCCRAGGGFTPEGETTL
ncbi:hypothetical protein BO221_29730 [Archangium sp. Cb G35]|nr:hypothetical protein BO221_29730 [Archangium sp. Cb G35]